MEASSSVSVEYMRLKFAVGVDLVGVRSVRPVGRSVLYHTNNTNMKRKPVHSSPHKETPSNVPNSTHNQDDQAPQTLESAYSRRLFSWSLAWFILCGCVYARTLQLGLAGGDSGELVAVGMLLQTNGNAFCPTCDNIFACSGCLGCGTSSWLSTVHYHDKVGH